MSAELLVPLDGSKAAEHVLPTALAIAAARGQRIHFLEVLDPAAEGPTGFAEPRRSDDIFRSYVAELVARHRVRPVEWSSTCVFGMPAETILFVSANADMIALASHGRGGVRSVLLGSVADRVVRGAHVPVLVVPALGPLAPFGTGPILVALDGSAESARSLPVARDLAARLGRSVALLEAYLPDMVQIGPAESDYYPPRYIESLEASIGERLATVALPGEQTLVARGPADKAIVEHATALDASLVVLASSRKGVAQRIAIGSSTSGVLHRWRRPALIVPPSTEDGGSRR